MKFGIAALAIVAAIAALFVKPPRFMTGGAAAGITPEPPAVAAVPAVNRNLPPAIRFVVVYVAGAVRKPGVYRLAATSRADDALVRAGGALPDADLVAVNLAAPLTDGGEIAVPTIGERPVRLTHVRAAHQTRGHRRHRAASARAGTAATATTAQIDLNLATSAQLEHVPGIGPGLAARIVAYRELNGPFTSADELADVAGITPRLQDALAAVAVIR